MTRFLIISLSLIIFGFSAFSKDYKIEELLEIAESNSNNIKSAQYLAKSKKHFANQQKYWNNPTIGFNKISGQDNYNITQTIPFYNKLQSRYDIEESEFEALEARKDNITLFVKAEVFRLIYQYNAIKKQIELSQKRLDRLSLVDKYLATIILSSPTKKAQSQITKDRIRLVERDLIRFKNELYKTWNAANIYLNLEEEPKNISLKWLNSDDYQGRNFFINNALENNLELSEQKSLIKKAKSELSYAKIEQMPDLNISALRENNSGSASNNKSANGIGVSLSIPLVNRNQEKVTSNYLNVKSQEELYEFQRNKLIQMIKNDLNEYETALKLSKTFSFSNIDQIIARLLEANSDFKKGVLDFITYIELDSQEYQMIDTIINTQIDLASSYSNLMIKVGSVTIPKYIKNDE